MLTTVGLLALLVCFTSFYLASVASPFLGKMSTTCNYSLLRCLIHLHVDLLNRVCKKSKSIIVVFLWGKMLFDDKFILLYWWIGPGAVRGMGNAYPYLVNVG